jgi:putative acyl-CoA dehydrogenase
MRSFSRGARVIGEATHHVENQAPWRVDLDEYALNGPLRDAVTAFGAGWADAQLHEIGADVGSAVFQRDAYLANVHAPVAQSHDRWGYRLDEVEYDPSYHRVIAAAIARGAHTSAWADPRRGASVARAAAFMLFAQIEPGHACPVSMTHAAVASIAGTPRVADEWLPRLYSREYEPRLLSKEHKSSALVVLARTSLPPCFSVIAMPRVMPAFSPIGRSGASYLPPTSRSIQGCVTSGCQRSAGTEA